MNAEEMGLEPDDPLVGARIAKRVMSATIVAATQTEPPHLVDVMVVNDQDVGIWHTIEPYNEVSEQSLQGWDVVRKRFVTFAWTRIVNAKSNSLNYTRATEVEWQQRQLITNLRWDQDKQVRQSVGVFWRGKKTPQKQTKRVVV